MGPWRLPGKGGGIRERVGMLGKDTGGGVPSLCHPLGLLPWLPPHRILGELEWLQLWIIPCPCPVVVGLKEEEGEPSHEGELDRK